MYFSVHNDRLVNAHQGAEKVLLPRREVSPRVFLTFRKATEATPKRTMEICNNSLDEEEERPRISHRWEREIRPRLGGQFRRVTGPNKSYQRLDFAIVNPISLVVNKSNGKNTEAVPARVTRCVSNWRAIWKIRSRVADQIRRSGTSSYLAFTASWGPRKSQGVLRLRKRNSTRRAFNL